MVEGIIIPVDAIRAAHDIGDAVLGIIYIAMIKGIGKTVLVSNLVDFPADQVEIIDQLLESIAFSGHYARGIILHQRVDIAQDIVGKGSCRGVSIVFRYSKMTLYLLWYPFQMRPDDEVCRETLSGIH
jgi:hypothetical protein